MRQKIVVIASLILLLFAVDSFAETVKVGILAKRGVGKCLEKWGQTVDYLSETIPGVTFELVPLKFDEVNKAVEAGRVHYFLTNSSMFITNKVKYGAEEILTLVNSSKQGEAIDQFGGVIFTSAYNDTINSLQDLKGKNFGAVKRSAMGGWQMALKEMIDEGIKEDDLGSLKFLGKHDDVVLAVGIEQVEAGTAKAETLERMHNEGVIDVNDFKVIAKKDHKGFPFLCSTALYPEWPLAKVAGTSDELTAKVVASLKALKADHPAAKAAKIKGWKDPLDYTVVEDLQKELKIGAYAQ